MKKILVPIDFSDFAQNAYEFACEIADKANGEVKLLHVVEYPAVSSFNTVGEVEMDQMKDPYMIGIVKKAKEELERSTFNKKFSNLKITYEVRVGNPYENIAHVIESTTSDLVVMGTKGASGIRELLIGSNAEKVVRFSKCPVITVRGQVRFSDIKNIVYGISLKEDQEKVMMELKGYISLFSAHLDLLWVETPHADEVDSDIIKQMEDLAKKHLLTNYSVNLIKAIAPDEGLMYYAEEQGCDMIALATHSRKGLAHIFTGSFAEDVVNHSQRPVWTYSLKN